MEKMQTYDISLSSIFKVVIVVLGLVFLYLIKNILIILFLAIIIASAVSPLVTRLESRYIPRVLGALLIYIICFSLLAFMLYLIIPPVVGEIKRLAILLPDYYDSFSKQIFKTTVGVSPDYAKNAQDFLINFGEKIKNTTSGILTAFSQLFGGMVAFGAIVVISFYLSVQQNGVKDFLRLVTPKTDEEYILRLWKRVEIKLGRWLQGELLLALIVGTLTFVGLSIIGVPYALLLGIITGFFELLPMVGPVLSAVLGVLIAFIISPVLALLTLIFYIILQQVENHILLPLLMKKITGLNPVIVIISLFIGAELGGVLGMLIAVPIATIAGELLDDLAKLKALNQVKQ